MSDPSEDDGRAGTADESPGVLSNLPRTRPQRSSARRTAAREAASSNGAAVGSPSAARAEPAQKRPDVSAREKRSAAPRGPKVGAKVPSRARSVSDAPTLERSSGSTPGARKGAARRAAGDAVPTQGFECENDRASGPVQPPGSSELAASAVEIVGELAKAGVSRGERLLKGVLGRLPLS